MMIDPRLAKNVLDQMPGMMGPHQQAWIPWRPQGVQPSPSQGRGTYSSMGGPSVGTGPAPQFGMQSNLGYQTDPRMWNIAGGGGIQFHSDFRAPKGYEGKGTGFAGWKGGFAGFGDAGNNPSLNSSSSSSSSSSTGSTSHRPALQPWTPGGPGSQPYAPGVGYGNTGGGMTFNLGGAPDASAITKMVGQGDTLAEQTINAGFYDRAQAMEAQGRSQGRYDQAIAGLQQGVDAFNNLPGQLDQYAQEQVLNPADDYTQEIRDRVNMTEAGFEDRSAQNVAAMRAGEASTMEDDMARIMSDPNMTEGEKRAAQRQLQASSRTRAMTAQQAEANAFNQQMAQLRTQGTQLISAALNNRVSAGVAMTQLKQSMGLAAQQAAQQGREAIASLMTQYPDSVFSVMSLMAEALTAQEGQLTGPGASFRTGGMA